MSIDALIGAAVSGDLDAVREMLNDDSTLARAKGGSRNCPAIVYLGFADPSIASLPAIALLLIERGGDPNATYTDDSDIDTVLPALYPAVGINDNPALADALLSRGANPNDGESIYHAAELNHRASLDVLLAHGADLSSRHGAWHNTPLYFLMGYPEDHASIGTVDAGIEWLLEHGANPNVTSYDVKETPLHRAVVERTRRTMIDRLIKCGADVNAHRADGVSAYRLALRMGNTEVADALREHGAIDDATRHDSFIGACMRGDRETVQQMLSADPEIVRRLNDEDRAMLIEAAKLGRFAAVELMLTIGFPIDAVGDAGATALHHAAWHGMHETVRLLLDHNPPLEFRDTSYQGRPIEWAAHGSLACRNPNGNYPMVARLLVDAGAELPDSPWGSDDVVEVLKGS